MGIGTGRAKIVTAFSRPAIGFTFQEVPHTSGPRLVGTSGGVIVELLGPPQDLTKVTLTSRLDAAAGETVRRNTILMTALLAGTVPGIDWGRWLAAVFTAARRATTRKDVTVRHEHGGRHVVFTIYRVAGTMTLVIT